MLNFAKRTSQRIRPFLATFRNRSLPVARLEGRAGESPGTVLFADRKPAARALALPTFTGETQLQPLPPKFLWNLAAFAEKSETADLSIFHVDALASRHFFPPDFLRVPDTVAVFLPTPDHVEALWRANSSLKDDMRLVRRAAMEMRVEGAEADIEGFYRNYYLPFVNTRHGELSQPREEAWLRGRLRDGASLLWVVRDGEKIAGAIADPIGEMLHLWVIGTRDGDPGLLKAGAVSAVYRFVIEFAQQQRCTTINFGLCQANMNDGVLRYKRKWGAEMRQNTDNSGFFLVHWRTWNHTVAAFLAANPIVHLQDDKLRVVTATGTPGVAGPEDLKRILQRIQMPGIDGYSIVNPDGWSPDVAAPPAVRLFDGTPGVCSLIEPISLPESAYPPRKS